MLREEELGFTTEEMAETKRNEPFCFVSSLCNYICWFGVCRCQRCTTLCLVLYWKFTQEESNRINTSHTCSSLHDNTTYNTNKTESRELYLFVCVEFFIIFCRTFVIFAPVRVPIQYFHSIFRTSIGCVEVSQYAIYKTYVTYFPTFFVWLRKSDIMP